MYYSHSCFLVSRLKFLKLEYKLQLLSNISNKYKFVFDTKKNAYSRYLEEKICLLPTETHMRRIFRPLKVLPYVRRGYHFINNNYIKPLLYHRSLEHSLMSSQIEKNNNFSFLGLLDKSFEFIPFIFEPLPYTILSDAPSTKYDLEFDRYFKAKATNINSPKHFFKISPASSILKKYVNTIRFSISF